MVIVGLDISTYCGMAKVDSDNPRDIVGTCLNFSKQTGPKRLESIAAGVERQLLVWQPDHIYVEAMAVYRASSAITVIGVGVMVRQRLYELGFSWTEVPPSTLKLWTTGKGNANKFAMALSVHEKWGYLSPSDDIVDAVALAQLGRHLLVSGGDSSVKGLSPGF